MAIPINAYALTCEQNTTETQLELLTQENAITFPILGLPGGEGTADRVNIFFQTETAHTLIAGNSCHLLTIFVTLSHFHIPT